MYVQTTRRRFSAHSNSSQRSIRNYPTVGVWMWALREVSEGLVTFVSEFIVFQILLVPVSKPSCEEIVSKPFWIHLPACIVSQCTYVTHSYAPAHTGVTCRISADIPRVRLSYYTRQWTKEPGGKGHSCFPPALGLLPKPLASASPVYKELSVPLTCFLEPAE